MDPGSQLYPKGYHPNRPSFYVPDPSSSRLARSPQTSRTLASVKYHIIDFGESVKFDSLEKRQKIYGAVGHHLEIPEFANSRRAYDPFAVDIRVLGEMLHVDFLEVSCSHSISPWSY